MSKIQKIDSNTINTINAEIKAKMEEVEKKFGIKIELGNSRYSKSYYTTKVKVATVSEDGKVKSKEAVQFEQQQRFGKISDKFEVGGRVRSPKGDVFIIDGYNSRARKYPVKLHNRDNGYKMSIDMLERCEPVSY